MTLSRGLELVDVGLFASLGVEALGVGVRTEIAVAGVGVGHQMPDDDQNGAADRYDRLLLALALAMRRWPASFVCQQLCCSSRHSVRSGSSASPAGSGSSCA